MNNQSNNERQRRYPIWKMLGLAFLSGFGTPIIKHPDERIAATSQRWAALGGSFMSIALGIAMVVRLLILKQDFRQCWDICLIWTVNLFVVCIGQIRSGVQPVGAVGRWSWKTSGLMILEIALLVPTLLWLMGSIGSLKAYVGSVALAGGSALGMQMILRAIYSKWERKTLGSSCSEEE